MARNNDLPVMTNEDGVECAWHLQEAGLPLGNGSHGICKEHADGLRQQRLQRRVDEFRAGSLVR